MKRGEKFGKGSSKVLLFMILIAFLASSASLKELDSYNSSDDTNSIVVQGADPSEGSTFLLWERDGGTWCDAEKEPPSDGAGNTNPGDMRYEDDLMCWAASASNVLEWTGWGLVNSMWTSDDMFDYFTLYWNDTGGSPYYGWHWWFGGYVPDPPNGKDAPDVEGGGAFWNASYNFYDYAFYENENETLMLPKAAEWLGLGAPVVFGIIPSTGSGGHYITCWGLNYDPAVIDMLDPNQYLGVWITDSDDDKNIAPPAPNALHYFEVSWNGTYWIMPDYYSGYCIVEVMALQPFPSNRPEAYAGPPRTGTEGSSIFLDAYGSDLDGDTLQYRWDLNDDGVWDTPWSASAAREEEWEDDYSGNVVLQVYDGHLLDIGSTYVTINNVAPTANAWTYQSVYQGEAVTFYGNFTDPGIYDNYTIEWDFGDGSTFYGLLGPVPHNYEKDGVYNVTLTVTDDDGGVGTATTTVTVDCLSDWRMFGHDLTRTGSTRDEAPESNFTLWKYSTDEPFISSPVVRNGFVYVGSNDKNVYCLDSATGAKIWNYPTDGPVFSSPTVVDDRVYVGSNDFKVYCLDALTGDFIWSYRTGYYVDSSPAVADGKVYVGSWDGKFYCLDANAGSLIWSYNIGGNIDDSSPAVFEGRVYVGSYDRNSSSYLDTVYCFDASTGAKIWSYRTGYHVQSSPTVFEGRLYVGSSDNKIYCLNAYDGTSIWNYTTGDMIISSPAVLNGKVYVGSLDRKVYCLDALTGALHWSFTSSGIIASSPAVADNKVYFGSYDENVYCLDALTGEQIWSYTTEYWVHSSPAIANGRIYIASEDRMIYAFGGLETTYFFELSGVNYDISVISNSIISGFSFEPDSKKMTLYAENATGNSGTQAFCNVSFPTSLLGGPYTVFIDESPVSTTEITNATHSTLSFSYTHSTHKIEIVGSTAIPESSPTILLLTIAILTSAFFLVFRKKGNNQSEKAPI